MTDLRNYLEVGEILLIAKVNMRLNNCIEVYPFPDKGYETLIFSTLSYGTVKWINLKMVAVCNS
jgi:hypothetical protein